MLFLSMAALALASGAVSQTSTTVPNTSTDIAAELATATALVPVSNVKGKAFHRLVVLMMENIDLVTAVENRTSSIGICGP
jgi:acid phosphatase